MCVQERLQGPHRLSRQHHHKKVKFQVNSKTPSTTEPSVQYGTQLPAPTCAMSEHCVTVMELQSQSIVRATEHSLPSSSMTVCGSVTSFLFLNSVHHVIVCIMSLFLNSVHHVSLS